MVAPLLTLIAVFNGVVGSGILTVELPFNAIF